MKKTKKLFITVLILVLCLCVAIPSFSWYDRDGSIQGRDIKLNEYYSVSGYNSDLSMVTYGGAVASNGRIVYKTDEELTDLTTTVESGDSAYFKTIITNKGADASTGLYLNNICDDAINSQVYIGSTSPIYTRRSFSPSASASKSVTNTMRVYFQPRSYWSGSTFYVFYYKTDDNYETIKMTYAGSHESASMGTTYATYYADIPIDTRGLFFSREEDRYASGSDRTQTMTDVISDGMNSLCCVVYYLTSSTSDTAYGNAIGDHFALADTTDNYNLGTNILNYYNKIYGDKGSSVSIALEQHVDYTGYSTKVSYKTSNSNVATVDSNGLVTINKNATVGSTCTITTSIGSRYNDLSVAETTVTVINSSSTLAVAENLEIKADSTVEVCWFVKNTTDKAIEFSAAGLVISL